MASGSNHLRCTDCHQGPEVHKKGMKKYLNAHAKSVACETCHITTYAEFTCENCHDSTELEFIHTHKEKDVSDIELANCIECHWDGENHD